MVAGNVVGARSTNPGDALPSRLPPGIVVVDAADPWRAAERVALALGTGRTFTAAEACEELDRRRAALLDDARAHLARRKRQAAAARRRYRTAVGQLPVPLGVSPASLLAAADTVGDAALVVKRLRGALGPRPHFDAEAARTAREAQLQMAEARLERDAVLPRANKVLLKANVGAVVVVAARLVTDAVDPAFFLVAALPLAGLGYSALTVARGANRSRVAARRRWTALRALGVCTLDELAEREREARAWDARAARVAAARADLTRAEAAWRALAGPRVGVADARRLAEQLEAAAALGAEADAAARAWAEAADLLQAVEDAADAGTDPVVVLDPDRSPNPERRRRLLRALARRAGRTPVVVVLAPEGRPDPRAIAAPRAAAPAPADSDGTLPARDPDPGAGAGGVVDLRERVVAGLLRLRSRQAVRRNPPSPGLASG